ncbi:MAG TPA: geranylgeranyl reductase family protein [Candidatus Lokiarchaeia archaeon]|nr:geranylgeranyl reductase family protein [Candidatus Lokiarchaeia archaeon]
MRKISVIVEGAGPAGATAAKKLAENGIDVLCIDKKKFPREKPCGGALSLNLLRSHPFLEKYVETNVRAGCIASGDNKYVLEYDNGERLGALVQRSIFDNDLLTEAKKAGAEVVESERVIGVKLSPQGVIVNTNKDQYCSEIVLGAGGTHDIVAKNLGLNPRWKPRHLALAYVIEKEFPENIMDEFFSKKRRLFFHLGFGGNDGYGWVFPKKRHLNVGLGAISDSNPKLKIDFLRYITFCQQLQIIPPFSVSTFQAALIPMRKILPRVFSSRCLLLGDAAGFINPINGEGIQYAIESGEIAADLVTGMVQSNNFAMHNFQKYQDICSNKFGNDLNGLRLLSKLILRNSTIVIKNAAKDLVLKDLALKLVQNAGDLTAIKRNVIKRFARTLIMNAFGRKN